MNKIKKIITSSILVISLLLTPSVVMAEAITVDGEDTPTDSSILDTDTTDASTDTTATTEANEDTAGVPDTGFAPTQNKVLASGSVFIAGALVGGALGFGFIKYRQKK